jgi:hypothetical protein
LHYLIYVKANVYFQYIDLWSSPWTWGGNAPPSAGQLAVITAGQTIYFDTTTDVLTGVIIIGGSLIFDDNQDVQLNAQYIIIIDNGTLQIGTEAQPFTHNAAITMYGQTRSIELPIFGAKVIGLRSGRIDVHGTPVGVTWTQLASTATAGSSVIVLKDQVNWPLGGTIVIATTGDKFSQGETETAVIQSIAADKKTITLTAALNFTHLGVTRTAGTGGNSINLDIRAEVGLLTRNVVISGSNDDSWATARSADACPSGFNPSEFAVQTCFQGRYGAEAGTDGFGATVMASPDMSLVNRESTIMRLSNVEFHHMGQDFRLGRYAIHFHMQGDSPSSYVKECAIHQSFNRAINIHATNYMTVTRNVIYDIKGGAFFLEDGVEVGNAFTYNLAVFVRTSSSLLNEDATPAAFWVTNANNTYMHNSVAGGTHFGFWYRLLDNPDGPSFDPNYCPKNIQFGTFYNNSVHSCGRFGVWIFPGMTPKVAVAGRSTCAYTTPSVAVFGYNGQSLPYRGLYSYGNDKAAEWVKANPIQFRGFVSFDETSEGIAAKTTVHAPDVNSGYASIFYSNTAGPAVADSYIIGNSDNTASTALTQLGLVIAWDRGQLVNNVTFINFPDSNSVAIRPPVIDGTCM